MRCYTLLVKPFLQKLNVLLHTPAETQQQELVMLLHFPLKLCLKELNVLLHSPDETILVSLMRCYTLLMKPSCCF